MNEAGSAGMSGVGLASEKFALQGDQPTVVQYVVRRFEALGVGHIFGVPGDYSFPIDDAFEASPTIQWVGCANELNAAYAADGYARIRGAALLSTTYGVGELSALNGVMGSKAEHVPVFHLVGHPSRRLQRIRAVTHHSLGDGDFTNFIPLSAAAACVSAELTPRNCIAELERVIELAISRSQPAHLYVAEDNALMPVFGTPPAMRHLDEIPRGLTNPRELEVAADAVLERLSRAKRPLAFVSHKVSRHRLEPVVTRFLEAANIPFATTPMDKTALDPHHPLFIGTYNGGSGAPDVQRAVAESDCVLDLGGVIWSDLNTGFWTDKVDKKTLVRMMPHDVQIGDDSYGPIWLGEMLAALSSSPRLKPFAARGLVSERRLPAVPGEAGDLIRYAALYPRLCRFLKEGDTVISDTGTCMLHLTQLPLPPKANFYTQTLWGSVGWGTPAALGMCLAAPEDRTVMVTGDGAHQMTANELGTMSRYGAKPILIVLNNTSYAVEELISETTGHRYNILAPWRYADLPMTLGCQDWYSVRVTTLGELEQALETASLGDRAVYIEVVIDPAEQPHPLPSEMLDKLYRLTPRDRG